MPGCAFMSACANACICESGRAPGACLRKMMAISVRACVDVLERSRARWEAHHTKRVSSGGSLYMADGCSWVDGAGQMRYKVYAGVNSEAASHRICIFAKLPLNVPAAGGCFTVPTHTHGDVREAHAESKGGAAPGRGAAAIPVCGDARKVGITVRLLPLAPCGYHKSRIG